MKEDHSGAAFPSTGSSFYDPEYGMTLRDYFAAKAMQAYLSNGERDSFPYDSWAEAAYQAADEMLEERKK